MEQKNGQSAPLTKDIKILLLQAMQRGFFDEAETETLLDFLNVDKSGFKVEVVEARWEIDRLEALHSLLSEDEADRTEAKLVETLRAMHYDIRKLDYLESEEAKREAESRRVTH